MIAAQRKNIEAITAANQVAFEGVQSIAKRQIEIARKATEELSQVAKELTAVGSPEDKIARQAALAKARDRKDAIHDRTEDYVRENPLTSAGLAFLAGVVLSRMLGK